MAIITIIIVTVVVLLPVLVLVADVFGSNRKKLFFLI